MQASKNLPEFKYVSMLLGFFLFVYGSQIDNEPIIYGSMAVMVIPFLISRIKGMSHKTYHDRY
ncbi:MAG: hypothetical protein NVSMB45_10320 [Ginsengibacter sp.]